MSAATIDQILALSASDPAPKKSRAKPAKPKKGSRRKKADPAPAEADAPASLAAIAVVPAEPETDPAALTATELAEMNDMPDPPEHVPGGPCRRCNGSGEKPPYGKCFRCEGDGVEPDPATAKKRWEEGQARKAKAAKRKAANDQQCDEPASLAAIVHLSNDGTGVEAPAPAPAPVAVAAGKEALKLAIADAVIGLDSPDNLPQPVQQALLAYYMAR